MMSNIVPGPVSGRHTFPWVLVIIGGCMLGVLAILAYALLNNSDGNLRAISIGEPVTDLEYHSYSDQPIRLSDCIGQVVVLNFWASWCQPCEDEAGFLQQAWINSQANGGVVFLGASYLDTERASQEYLDRFGITYPNGLDRQNRLSARLGVTGVPETFFINPEGVLVYHQIGPFMSMEQILNLIQFARE